MTMPIADEAEGWLGALEQALDDGGRDGFDELFLEECYWRDMVALTWDTCQFWDRDAVREAMVEHAVSAGIANLRLDAERSAPRMAEWVGEPFVEMFFAFGTAVGAGKGFARLALDASAKFGLRAQLIATGLVALNCAPEPTGRIRGRRGASGLRRSRTSRIVIRMSRSSVAAIRV